MSTTTTTTFVIEKQVLIPPRKWQPTKRGEGPNQTLLRRMAVGDSVKIDNPRAHVKATSLLKAAKRLNIKIVTRAVEGGMRVWRVE